MTLSAIFQANWITDSTGGGTIFGHATFQGGKGRASEYLANKFASIPGMGPVLSPGDRLVGSTALDVFPTGELAYSGSGWSLVRHLTGATATHGGSTTAFTSTAHGLANGTPVVVNGLTNTLGGGISNGSTYYVVNTATNTFGLAATSGGTALTLGGSSNDSGTVSIGEQYDKLPYALLQIASGATNILTLDATKYAAPLVAVDVLVVDLIGGGDLSLSIDGGTWTACGQTMTGSNNIIRFRVMTPGMTTSLRVRCANAAGTAVLGAPGGFRPWYVDHTTVTNGVIVNDYGVDGQALHGFITTSVAGDHAAILDSVTLGTGNPLGNTPNVTMMLHLNDANFPSTGSGTSWSTDTAAFKTRAGAVSPIVLIGCWEADPTFFDATVQATMRSTLAALADSNTYYLDLNGAYGAMGYSGNAAISAGGFLQDKIHLAPQGEADVGDRLFRFLRNGPLSSTIGGNVSAFTLGHSLLGGTDVFGGTPSFNTFDAGARATESDAANAGTARSTPTAVRATEADTASPGTATATAAGTRATETDAANAGVTASTATGARASETDVANEGAPSAAAAGARATETDAAAAGTVETNVVGHRNPDPIFWPEGEEILWPEGEPLDWGDGISEYDTANAGTPVATAAGAQAAESDTANVGAIVTTVLGVQAVESDAASPGSVPATGQQATESDAASPGAVITTVFGVQAIEASSAPAGSAASVASGARAAEADAATSGTIATTAAGIRATEVDAAEVGAGSTAVVGIRAVEADSAAAGTVLATVTGAQAQEADTAPTSDGSTIPGTRGAESDTANPGTVVTTVVGTKAVETDTGTPGTPTTVVSGARATETDTTSPGTPTTNVAGARAVEPNVGIISRTHTTATGQQAVENDTARSGACTIVVTGGRAIDASTASPGVAAVTVFGGLASEIDVASVGLVPGATFIVTFSVRAARDGWQFTASADGWRARPARDGWKVEAR